MLALSAAVAALQQRLSRALSLEPAALGRSAAWGAQWAWPGLRVDRACCAAGCARQQLRRAARGAARRAAWGGGRRHPHQAADGPMAAQPAGHLLAAGSGAAAQVVPLHRHLCRGLYAQQLASCPPTSWQQHVGQKSTGLPCRALASTEPATRARAFDIVYNLSIHGELLLPNEAGLLAEQLQVCPHAWLCWASPARLSPELLHRPVRWRLSSHHSSWSLGKLHLSSRLPVVLGMAGCTTTAACCITLEAAPPSDVCWQEQAQHQPSPGSSAGRASGALLKTVLGELIARRSLLAACRGACASCMRCRSARLPCHQQQPARVIANP